MISVPLIKKEHEQIERELLELEAIMDEEEESEAAQINFANLTHVFNRLHSLWDSHEKKEESLFERFRAQGIEFPVEEILFTHKVLKRHRKVLSEAIDSGSEFEIKTALDTDGRMMIDKLREHIKNEKFHLDKVIKS